MTGTKPRNTRRNFGLLALAIACLAGGVLARALAGGTRCTMPDAARIHLELLAEQLKVHRLDVGAFPDGLDELIWSQAPGWRGPYAWQRQLLDPWKERIRYERIGDGFRLVSYGPDRAPGGKNAAADIEVISNGDG